MKVAEQVELRAVPVGERCEINGYGCKVVRHARKTTFVEIVSMRGPVVDPDDDLVGQVVQLDRKKVVVRVDPAHAVR